MMTVSQLAMLTVVAVASLRSLPAMADYGLASILLYLIPAVVFLVPTALVAAELATGWKGGVYVWVREAFGNRIGFLAIWLQWIQNVVWYPIQIAFIAVSLSYVFGMGGLGNNGVYVAAVIIVLYWASTMVALRGGNLFAKVGSISGLIGTLFPALLLIVFGIIWLAIGKPVQTSARIRAASAVDGHRVDCANRIQCARLRGYGGQCRACQRLGASGTSIPTRHCTSDRADSAGTCAADFGNRLCCAAS